jgi:hypothetical protein
MEEQKYIVYQSPINEDEYLVVIPASHLPIEYVAQKDVPNGSPYKILSVSQLPYRFWEELQMYEFDLSNPDGYGMGAYYDDNGNVFITSSFEYESFRDWKEDNL